MSAAAFVLTNPTPFEVSSVLGEFRLQTEVDLVSNQWRLFAVDIKAEKHHESPSYRSFLLQSAATAEELRRTMFVDGIAAAPGAMPYVILSQMIKDGTAIQLPAVPIPNSAG